MQDALLEYASSGTFKIKRLKMPNNFEIYESKKTNGPKQVIQNQLRSYMYEGGELFLLPKTFNLVGFQIFWLLAYTKKVIPETSRAH